MQPETIAQLVGDLGAIGFILWLTHRLTTHTIPKMTEHFTMSADKQRADFRDILERQRSDFAQLHQQEHDMHEARMSTLVDAVRTIGTGDH